MSYLISVAIKHVYNFSFQQVFILGLYCTFLINKGFLSDLFMFHFFYQFQVTPWPDLSSKKCPLTFFSLHTDKKPKLLNMALRAAYVLAPPSSPTWTPTVKQQPNSAG
jgi:hypothetical protein